MRYTKYSKIISCSLFSLILAFTQCKKETIFYPYPCIKGLVTDASSNEKIEGATVMLWIEGSGLDTLTYITDSNGVYSTERINNWFGKSLTLEAFKLNSPPGEPLYAYTPAFTSVSPYILNSNKTITSDTLYIDFELFDAPNAFHIVIPKKLDFPVGEDRSSFMILNNGFKTLNWGIGENNTEWMSVYWIEVYNTASDIYHLKPRGYVRFLVRINRELLNPGSYDTSILVITDQGNTLIPVHVIAE